MYKIDYYEERARAQVALTLADLLEKENYSKQELAQQIDLTIEQVDEMLSADYKNITIELLARIAKAINREFEVKFCKD